jgi:caffeoyl-CoA O-methyltransferase
MRSTGSPVHVQRSTIAFASETCTARHTAPLSSQRVSTSVSFVPMAGIVPEDIEQYALAHTTPVDGWMDALAEETRSTLRSPGMLSGAVEGRLLEMLVFASGARRVLEFGTYSGYSALSMARALPPDGRIFTLEVDPQHAEFAQRHIEVSPYASQIEILLGPALESVERLEGPFDLVFIDADKENYARYYEAALPKLSPRGLIAVDNTLWSGAVLDPDAEDASDATRALAAFNHMVVADPRVVCVMLTIRDGVTLIRPRL